VQRVLAAFPTPPGVELRFAGAERERRATLTELAWLALLAVVLVFMVLAGLFESLRHPFTVLLTVPMGLTGAALALWLHGQPLGVMAGIGFVILAGIVVNNSIVLVDYVGTLRSAGWERRAALAEAARVRLRPILMTSLTTMLGLLPQLLRLGPGAELRAPLALVVVGGLLSATLTTLLVIPVAYDIVDDLPPRRAPRPDVQPAQA
jgi:HAE1 family hydrophobic/amphiphilic exporter-1